MYNSYMSEGAKNQDSLPGRGRQFDSTHWSLVLAAGGGDAKTAESALAELCQNYWPPLYAFVLRKTGDVHKAQDMTQAFFVHLLQKRAISFAEPNRGRFRTFLLTSLQNFLRNEWRAGKALKRGGGKLPISMDFQNHESHRCIQPVSEETPEQTFEREWALAVLKVVLGRLQTDWESKGKALEFAVLKQFLTGRHADGNYTDAAKELGMTTGSVKTAASRMRSQYRKLVRAEIAQTVENPMEVDDEIKRLFQVLGG